MLRPNETIDAYLARMREEYNRTHEIRCPYCQSWFEDEDCDHVTYHGEPSQKTAICNGCDNEFIVTEKVDRTWETRKTGEDEL